jgi:hypothetical protein
MSMPGVEASESELREHWTAILCVTPPLMQVLSVARRLNLPDWLVFSGADYQPVLNHLMHRPATTGSRITTSAISTVPISPMRPRMR